MNEIQVWSWRLDAGARAATDAFLSQEERARGSRFVSAELRERFGAARGMLRSLLGRHLGVDPAGLVFVENAFGKPRLADHPSLHFNLSHSADRALLALSESVEVGADLERLRALDHLELARRNFHPNEVAAIDGAGSEERQREAFFRIWVLKEAVVKATGRGLTLPLDSFEVSIAGARPAMASWQGGAPPPWWLHLESGAYCRALAAPAEGAVGLIQRTI